MKKFALGLLLAVLPVVALAQTAAMNKSVPTVPVSPNDSMVRTPEVNTPSGQGSVIAPPQTDNGINLPTTPMNKPGQGDNGSNTPAVPVQKPPP